MRIRSAAKKVAWVLLGLFLGLASLEIALRAAALAYRAARLPDPGAAQPASGRTILCIGDSFTFGAGAPPGSSYPDRLQAFWDAKAGAGRYRVVNAGFPGANSAQAKRQLEERLKTLRPDVVIVLAGMNDGWNFEGMDFSGPVRWTLPLQRSLLRVKVLKFLRLLRARSPSATCGAGAAAKPDPSAEEHLRIARSLRRDPRKASEHFAKAAALDPCREEAWLGLGWTVEKEQPSRSLECFKKALAINARSARALIGLGHLHRRRDPERALGYLQDALRLDPGLASAHSALGWALVHKDPARAAASFRSALRLDPRAVDAYLALARGESDSSRAADYLGEALRIDPGFAAAHCELGRVRLRQSRLAEAAASFEKGVALAPDSMDCYQQLARTYRAQGRPEKILESAKKDPRLRANPAYPAAANLAQLGQGDRPIEDNTEKSFREIIALAERRRFKLVFCSYPQVEIDAARRIAAGSKIPYVDFEPLFKNRFARESQYLVPDGHCNAAGYAFMAQTLVGVVERLLGP